MYFLCYIMSNKDGGKYRIICVFRSPNRDERIRFRCDPLKKKKREVGDLSTDLLSSHE